MHSSKEKEFISSLVKIIREAFRKDSLHSPVECMKQKRIIIVEE